MLHDADSHVEIAELKEVIGRLWKKVDEFQLHSKSDNEHLLRQVGEWTQTNLFLLKLLSDQTEETKHLAEHSSKLSSTLEGLKRQLKSLRELPTTSSAIEPSLFNTFVQPLDSYLSKLEQISQSLSHQTSQLQTLQHIQVEHLNNPTISKPPIQGLKVGKLNLPFPNLANTSTGLITVSYLLLTILNFWLGWQLRLWQIKSNPDFLFGQQLIQWNQLQLQSARQQGQQKSTIWIVPPPSNSN